MKIKEIRRMLFAMVVVGTFWHLWNIIFGDIPSLSSFLWMVESGDENPATITNLSFGISRSWDTFAVPVFVWIYANLKARTSDEDALVFASYLGLISCLLLGLMNSLIVSMIFGLCIVLGSGLICGRRNVLISSLTSGLTYSLVVGSFKIGLLPALAYFMMITSPIWIILFVFWLGGKIRTIPWNRAKEIISD